MHTLMEIIEADLKMSRTMLTDKKAKTEIHASYKTTSFQEFHPIMRPKEQMRIYHQVTHCTDV